jgi:Rrf2 family protein
MSLVSRKGLLAITAVVDVALHSRSRPVSAKELAARHALPPRHLEPVLQALVRDGILKGMRGPRGGYALARHQRDITAEDILRAAESAEQDAGPAVPDSLLLGKVVLPAMAAAEASFSAALAATNVEALAAQAQMLGV